MENRETIINWDMEIKIEDYLSPEEIREIVTEEVKRHVRDCIGNVSTSPDKGRELIGKLAKTLAKEGVQELIPNFKEMINEHIQTTIKEVKLSDFFVHSFGWSSTGNKILNGVLSDNKALIDAKVKEIFQTVDKQ